MNDYKEQPPAGLGISQDIGPWQVHMEWPQGVFQGGPRYLTVRPRPGVEPHEVAGGLSSTVVRQIDFQSALAKWREFSDGGDVTEFARVVRNLANDLSGVLRDTLSDGVNERYLAWLSLAYLTVVGAGEGSVVANLAELIRRKPETVRGHLKAARSQGLLTRMEGRAGGELTMKAKKVLEDNVQRMRQKPDG